MDDPELPEGSQKPGFTWRMRRTANEGRLQLADQATFEYADTDGVIAASFSMPIEMISGLLLPHLSIFAELRLDGAVSLDAEPSTAFDEPPHRLDILQMVSDALSPEMLEDEPEAKDQLTVLRRRLTDALALVDRTLTDFDEQPD
jgi:hypothetical protein